MESINAYTNKILEFSFPKLPYDEENKFLLHAWSLNKQLFSTLAEALANVYFQKKNIFKVKWFF